MSHQPYPKTIYHPDGGVSVIDTPDQFPPGWYESPVDAAAALEPAPAPKPAEDDKPKEKKNKKQ